MVTVSSGLSLGWWVVKMTREAGSGVAALYVACLLEMLAGSLGDNPQPAVTVCRTYSLSKVVEPSALKEVFQSPPLWQTGLRCPRSTYHPGALSP